MKKIVFVSLTACLIVAVTSRMLTLAQPSANCIQAYENGVKEYEESNYPDAKKYFKISLRLSDNTDMEQNLMRAKIALMLVSTYEKLHDSTSQLIYLSNARDLISKLTVEELKDPELKRISEALVKTLKESNNPHTIYADISKYAGKYYTEADLIEAKEKHEISINRSKYKKEVENILTQLFSKYKVNKQTAMEIKISHSGKINKLDVFGSLENPDLLKAIREIQLPCPDQNFFGVTDTTKSELCFYIKIPPSKND